MALQKREKLMLKILAGVAVVSGIILLQTLSGPDQDAIEEKVVGAVEDANAERDALINEATGGGGGGSRRGGAARSSSGGETRSVTSADFQSHASPGDCWVLLEGQVYDVTPIFTAYPVWIESIKPFCGTFGFEAGFISEHPDFTETIKNQASPKGVIR